MDKYIPDSCPLRKDPIPDESEYTYENCFGCENRCISSSVAILKRALVGSFVPFFDALFEKVREMAELLKPLLQDKKTVQDLEIKKRRKAHLRTWKRRERKNGNKEKDR